MKQVSLSGSSRESVGKKGAKAVRNEGRIPAVVYGGDNQLHLSLGYIDFEKLVNTPNVYTINLDVEGTKKNVIIQEVQYHPVTDRIQHVDFIELFDNKKVKVDVPVILEGRAIGVMNGGKLSQVFRRLKVYALPANLPDAIKVDISKLRIGQVVRVGDLITDDLNILNPPSAVVCSIKMARGAVNAEEEEGTEEAAEGTEEVAAEAAPAAEEGAEG